MARWITFGMLAGLTACQGGAHEMVQAPPTHAERGAVPTGAVAANGGRQSEAPVDPHAPQVAQPAANAAASDSAPRLVTVASRNRPALLVPHAAAGPTPPPSGGYVVRTPGALASGDDTDHDRIPDARDRCPTEPETYNGVADDDGCPDRGAVVVEGGERIADARPADATASPHRPTGGVTHSTTATGIGMGAGHGASASAPATASAEAPVARPRFTSEEMGYHRDGDGVADRRAPAMEPAPVARPSRSRGFGFGRSGGGGLGGDVEHAVSANMDVAAAPPPAPPATMAAPRGPAPGGTRITVAVGPAPVPPPESYNGAADEAEAQGGRLTAASVGDTDRRGNYTEYLSRHQSEAESLGLDLSRRVRFRVVDAQNHGVNNALVALSGGASVTGRTHADGYWDFYPSVSAPNASGQLAVHVQVENVGVDSTVTVPAHGDGGDVLVRLPAVVAPPPPALDLQFAIDVTGSMGDELRYVNQEVTSIVRRIQSQAQGVHVRVGATFYRDRTDDLVVQQIPFTQDVPGFAGVMGQVFADGGGDYPEDMNAGLDAAINGMAWSDGPAVRVLVLIADAPPQRYGDENFTYRNAMQAASQRGIRVLPVAASGADRTVEYLFRAMGAFTSTPYVYLTDDSGVGAPHMEADTDRVGVERFADLLTRLVISDLRGQGMHEPGPLGAQD